MAICAGRLRWSRRTAFAWRTTWGVATCSHWAEVTASDSGNSTPGVTKDSPWRWSTRVRPTWARSPCACGSRKSSKPDSSSSHLQRSFRWSTSRAERHVSHRSPAIGRGLALGPKTECGSGRRAIPATCCWSQSENMAGTTVSHSPPPKQQRRSWWRWIVYALILLALNYTLVSMFLPNPTAQRVNIPYTLFNQQVQASNVAAITASGDTLQGRFKQPVSYTPPNTTTPEQVTAFATVQPTFSDPNLLTELEQQGVVVNATSLDQSIPWWENLLFSFGPTVLLIGGFLWLNSRMQGQMGGAGGIFGIGRSRATRYNADDPKRRITFNDVAGIDEAKNELVEVVDFLKEPRKYTRLGGTVPKGVLLVGPPGTGKTLLARAVAGEANVPFFSIGASEFVEMIVGVGASRVRDLFAKARAAAPSIIFIDELDAIGRSRAAALRVGGTDEQEQTMNQILTEMDGFDSREGVIVLAATNRADVLDPALLRPGRFDRRVTVQPPDRRGREQILKIHTRNVPLAPGLDLSQVAAQTPGLVGADLRNIVNE